MKKDYQNKSSSISAINNDLLKLKAYWLENFHTVYQSRKKRPLYQENKKSVFHLDTQRCHAMMFRRLFSNHFTLYRGTNAGPATVTMQNWKIYHVQETQVHLCFQQYVS